MGPRALVSVQPRFLGVTQATDADKSLQDGDNINNYVEVLETGSVEALQAYARNLSERILPRGVGWLARAGGFPPCRRGRCSG